MLQGKKTYIGAGLLLLNGLYGLLGCLLPDLGDGPCDPAGSMELIGQGMVGLGLRAAL